MKLPFIIIVDDDEHVLRAIQRDIRNRYRDQYRVAALDSAKEALELIKELKLKNENVALFISDQRMPEMEGIPFLEKAREFYPDAKFMLLTAYSDIEAAIRAINNLKLDYYLLKPWNPPEEKLYPVVDDMLEEWSANTKADYDGIKVLGTRWSSKSYSAKEFLSRNLVPYLWVDIDQDDEMRKLAQSVTADITKLPVIIFPDGSHLIAPTNNELATKVGMHTQAKLPFYDLVIVGAGPAGLAAGVYGASEGLKTLILEQNAPGGQAGTSSQIENYLGFPTGISGADLARRATTQAKRFNAEILNRELVSVKVDQPYKTLKLNDGSEVSCKAVIFTAGVAVRMLNTEGMEQFLGCGVYYGTAMTEAATYKGQNVCILGGGNSAGQAALFFSRYVNNVTIIIRADSLHKAMSSYLIERIESAANIQVLTDTQIISVHGNGKVDMLKVKNIPRGEITDVQTSAIFIFIGSAPRTEMIKDLIETDDKGYILTGPDIPRKNNKIRGWTPERDPFLLETNIPGIFAAGDVRSGSGKRVAAAVGEGSAAVGMVHRYLETV